jgi:hypothetical protein
MTAMFSSCNLHIEVSPYVSHANVVLSQSWSGRKHKASGGMTQSHKSVTGSGTRAEPWSRRSSEPSALLLPDPTSTKP